MSGNVEIRVIKSDDESEIDGLVSLHNKAYGDCRTPGQWRWEYMGHYPELSVFGIIDDSGRVVGSQGMMPIYLNIGGKAHLSGKSESSLLNPDYRGGTLFQDVYAFSMDLCKKKGMCCVWGFTPAVKVWRKKLNFNAYENVLHQATLVLDLKGAIVNISESDQGFAKKKAKGAVYRRRYSAFKKSLARAGRNASKKKDYVLKDRLNSLDDMARLYDRLRRENPGMIHINQDENYMNWRIYNNPNVSYKTHFLYEKDRLLGYAYSSSKDGNAYITDVTFESPDAGSFLLYTLLSKWHDEVVSAAYFFGNMENSLMRKTFDMLETFQFQVRALPEAFILKNISHDDEESLYEMKNWYACGLWREGYTY